jgi:hypothetical protein
MQAFKSFALLKLGRTWEAVALRQNERRIRGLGRGREIMGRSELEAGFEILRIGTGLGGEIADASGISRVSTRDFTYVSDDCAVY